MQDPRRANDPRLGHYLDSLPTLRTWLETAITRAAADGPASADWRLASAGIHLGIKLCEANRLALRVETTSRVLPRKANLLREYLADWVRLSADLDSFVFAAYGALDALAQAIVAACEVETADEVKFPHLERLLADSAAPTASALRAQVADIIAAPWFVALRHLRNLVNYRAVLPATPTGALPLSQPRAPWAEPPLPALDRLDALPPWTRDTLAQVAQTVEELVTSLPR